jgi:hypothetical protein
MRTIFPLLLVTLAWLAAAQTPDGISAPVSRTLALTADEADFTITVAAAIDSTQQQVKEALENAGLPNPTVVATSLSQDTSTYPPGAAQIRYSATVAISTGSALDTARRLETLRFHLPSPLQNLQYSVAFNPSQATVDAIRQVVWPQLLGDSRKLAQSLASAAGVKLGAIRSISDSAGVAAVPQVVTATFLLGVFRPLLKQQAALSDTPASPLPSTQYTFYLNVVFAAAP